MPTRHLVEKSVKEIAVAFTAIFTTN